MSSLAEHVLSLPDRHFLFVIIILALSIRLAFFVGLNWSDDPIYVHDAYLISRGESFRFPHVLGLRIGQLYPIALCFKLLGVSNFTASLYPLLCSLSSIALVYYFARHFFDEITARLSAALLAVYTLDVINSTWIMTEIPSSFFMSLSIVLFLYAEKAGRCGRDSAKSLLAYIFSGFAFGYSYLIRETGIILSVFFILYLLINMAAGRLSYITYLLRSAKKYAIFAAGILIPVLFEGALYLTLYNDFFFRYHLLNEHFNAPNAAALHALITDLGFYPRAMFNIGNDLVLQPINKYYMEYGFFFYYVLAALVFLSVYWIATNSNGKKHAFRYNSLLVILWLLSLFLFLQFGSFSLTHYSPLHRQTRHLTIITLPGILLLSISYRIILASKLKNLLLGRIRTMLVAASILFFIGSSLYFSYHIHAKLKDDTLDQVSIAEFIKDNDLQKPIYMDTGTLWQQWFYSQYTRKNLLPISSFDCTSTSDAYVVIGGSNLGWLINDPPDQLPICIRDINPNWRLVKVFNASNIEYNAFLETAIYYVP